MNNLVRNLRQHWQDRKRKQYLFPREGFEIFRKRAVGERTDHYKDYRVNSFGYTYELLSSEGGTHDFDFDFMKMGEHIPVDGDVLVTKSAEGNYNLSIVLFNVREYAREVDFMLFRAKGQTFGYEHDIFFIDQMIKNAWNGTVKPVRADTHKVIPRPKELHAK